MVTSWNVPFFAERSFLYGVATRISTETSTHSNPLTLLYQPLSKQLHTLTDEECLQQAADIRVVLTALLENIADVLKNQDELREAATRLKNPRQQPG